MLRVHLLEESQHAKSAALLLVEVGDVVSELEVFANLALFLLIHLAHDIPCDVGRKIHKGDSTSASSEGNVVVSRTTKPLPLHSR